MDINNGLFALLLIGCLVVGLFGGIALFGGTEVIEVETEKVVIQEKLVEKECPAMPACPEVVIPEVESADNYLLNEFLEEEFSTEFNLIKDAAEEHAEKELEDHDYEVVFDHLKTLLAEGEEIDEQDEVWYLDMDIDDVEIKVTKLGLAEDEDKSARVTFEIEVEYELEEGVVEEYKKDFVVVYDVVFDEGDFDDEEVEFVSIE